MFRTILVPTDGSELAEKAVKAAIELARQIDGMIVAVAVAEPAPIVALSEGGAIPGDLHSYEDKAKLVAQLHAQRVKDEAALANVPCEMVVKYAPRPYEEIIAAAKQFNCDAIFMSSHGRTGLNRLILGSQTQKVLAHTNIPVLVFR